MKIAKMQDHIDAMQLEITALRKELGKGIQPIKWEPSGGMWYVNGAGSAQEQCQSAPLYRLGGGEFSCRSSARKAACTYKAYHRLYKLAEELNDPGWLANFSSGDRFYKVDRTNQNGVLQYDFSFEYVETLGTIYFRNQATVKRAIVILEQEED